MDNKGRRVKVHYVGTLDDGTEFDSSIKRGEPIEFVCMAGQMIPGFDAAVVDMKQGETRNVHIPCADAYGERDEKLIQKIPVADIPNGDKLPVGEQIYVQGPNGQPIPCMVTDITDGVATFDLNSEMAGKDLNFEITLVEIVNTAEE
ncbi:MAG: peptidylprolyl isomerase [Eggerthellaceae bacterium]|jgi:FKBP-type peptidyl-prolyl cis-trans isomerase 2|nr:peptidylprolyl isomerase [Eggerthellaceae bacterium]MCH4221109.1 peptidylprolyl isomerase [Eggerthellaceae bacterium]